MDALSNVKIPEPPIIAAGAIGGPLIIYSTTPLRNALTIAASNASFSVLKCYRESFSTGFFRAWVGGQYYAVAACPQFVCLGPMYHIYESAFGAVGGVLCAGVTESLVVHGAEKKNAQLSVNARGGKIPVARIQNPFNPFGNGLPIHIGRNILACSGMRVLTTPALNFYERRLGKSAGTTLLADLSANVVSAWLSMPFHQVWNFTVSTPEMWEKPSAERISMMQGYIRRQWLVTTESGATRVSSVIFRDLFLRSVYIGIMFTAFANLERSFVKFWPR